ncbi:GHKL domain-containing protein [Aquimarina sp. MAR_2010_214]|uniref:sensor histidine kinase n=1 Tax=Aquimarina sp. MAR_2010_214 TaxID=1250026 RepID=UPI000CA7C7C5|nr:sensor histidine kinase [Aquimarina sp. MAR_2010_214]PKV51912.1 GHKL domain-containing protein [Aquimarina sp. MAR_2010_214]
MGKDGGYPMTFLHELNSLFFKMAISYFLYLWFFPKKNKTKYVPLVLIGFVVNAFGYEFTDHFFHPEVHNFWLDFVSNTLTYLSFGVVFFTIYIVKNTYKKQLQIDRLIQEKQRAEIDVLKARVNPHFLFNTLNTIYANALKKDDKTPELILKLSDNFRYVLHQGQNEYVAIKKEIRHIKDYIHLQQERLANKVVVHFSEDIDELNQQIAPLLCIGFIENAFKYTSILKGNNHKIDINIQLKNKQFIFFCSNPFNKNAIEEIDLEWKESGVGIHNTKERLQLLYPLNHTLEIRKENSIFEVQLNVQL